MAQRCYWCGVQLTRKLFDVWWRHTRDHVISQAYGGKETTGAGKSNIVDSCLGCNQMRGREMANDWKQYGKWNQICRNKWQLTYPERERDRLHRKWKGYAGLRAHHEARTGRVRNS
jgi:hypothetical protein